MLACEDWSRGLSFSWASKCLLDFQLQLKKCKVKRWRIHGLRSAEESCILVFHWHMNKNNLNWTCALVRSEEKQMSRNRNGKKESKKHDSVLLMLRHTSLLIQMMTWWSLSWVWSVLSDTTSTYALEEIVYGVSNEDDPSAISRQESKEWSQGIQLKPAP
jgi:hypothetical protein